MIKCGPALAAPVAETAPCQGLLIIINSKTFLTMQHRLHFDCMRWVMGVLVGCVLSMSLIACDSSDDEPTAIGYYVMIMPKVPIYSMGGIAPPPKEHMIGEITRKMKRGIDEVYPVRNQQGNDVAVMMVCDSLYRCYYETYRGGSSVSANGLAGTGGNTDCVVTLYRARMSGYIVRSSTPLKTYRF